MLSLLSIYHVSEISRIKNWRWGRQLSLLSSKIIFKVEFRISSRLSSNWDLVHRGCKHYTIENLRTNFTNAVALITLTCVLVGLFIIRLSNLRSRVFLLSYHQEIYLETRILVHWCFPKYLDGLIYYNTISLLWITLFLLFYFFLHSLRISFGLLHQVMCMMQYKGVHIPELNCKFLMLELHMDKSDLHGVTPFPSFTLCGDTQHKHENYAYNFL